MKKNTLFALVVLFVFSLHASDAKSGTPGTINGFVSDSTTHAGIGGAVITLDISGGPVTTITNGTGYYLITVPSGTWSIIVEADGYNSEEDEIEVQGETSTPKNFELEPDNTIPTLSEWGMFVFALLIVMVGMIVIRRRVRKREQLSVEK